MYMYTLPPNQPLACDKEISVCRVLQFVTEQRFLSKLRFSFDRLGRPVGFLQNKMTRMN